MLCEVYGRRRLALRMLGRLVHYGDIIIPSLRLQAVAATDTTDCMQHGTRIWHGDVTRHELRHGMRMAWVHANGMGGHANGMGGMGGRMNEHIHGLSM